MSGSGQSTGTSTPDVRPPHIQAIVTQLESTVTMIVAAVNARFFDLSSPLLSEYVDPGFAAPPMPPYNSALMSIEAWRDYMSNIIDQFPEYNAKILGLETEVNERAGTANVFMNFEVTGTPPGVTRHSVGCVKFRKTDEKWRMFGYEGVDGMEGTEGGSWP